MPFPHHAGALQRATGFQEGREWRHIVFDDQSWLHAPSFPSFSHYQSLSPAHKQHRGDYTRCAQEADNGAILEAVLPFWVICLLTVLYSVLPSSCQSLDIQIFP